MIINAAPWKGELRRQLEIAKRLSTKPVADDDEFIMDCEHFFYWSSFIIRKLKESHRLSDELTDSRTPVVIYPKQHAEEDLNVFNFDNANYWFDLNAGRQDTLNVSDLCNCFIHSYIFQPMSEDPDVLVGVLVTSDWQKKTSLYQVELADFCKLIEEVLEDEVGMFGVDERTGKYVHSRKVQP